MRTPVIPQPVDGLDITIVWGLACSWQTSCFAKTLAVPKTSHEAQYSLPDQHKNPPAQPEREILCNALQCHWEIPEGFRFPGCMCAEKKKSLPKKLQNSHYRLRHTTKLLQWQPVSQSLTCAWSHPVAGMRLPGLA